MMSPLQGVKVLELGHIVAGPSAGQMLGDMGADVVKVETVDGGDKARSMPGGGEAMFHFLNRNKRSIALNLKDSNGKRAFLALASSADVVIDNYAHGVIERLGIGHDVASADNPGLIWLSIRGFMPGPAEAQPMLDELAQMAGGLAYMTGPEGTPMRAGASVIDVGAAAYGVMAVLAALRQKEVGKQNGQYIVAGLYETSVYTVGQWMATSQFTQQQSLPMSTERQDKRMGFFVYRLFDTADNSKVFIGVTSDAHWARFCKEFGFNDLAADARFIDGASRLKNLPDLQVEVARLIRQLPAATVESCLLAAKVPFAPVRRPDQLANEQHLLDSQQLFDVEFPNGVTAKLPKLPFRASGFEMELRRASPRLGEHTREILLEHGFTESEVDALKSSGALRE